MAPRNVWDGTKRETKGRGREEKEQEKRHPPTAKRERETDKVRKE